MGFDIQGFIAKVEKFVNEGKTDRQGKTDGKFDSYEKASLFNNRELLNELGTACEEDLSVQQQVQNDLGISLSSIKSRIQELTTAGAKSTRSAGGDNGGNGDTAGGINIFINNSVNINVEINISTEIKNEINNNLSCGCGGPGGADVDALVDILKKLLGDGGSVQEFILYIFNQFSEKLGLDMGNIQELLKQILSKLDSQEQTINKMNDYLVELMKQNYNALAMMGLKMDTLIEIVQKGNVDNIEILGKIYTAIMDLTGQFSNFTQVEQNQFNQIMDMLKNGNVNLEQVLALLNAIKNDTSENNKISQNILKAIVEGKKEVLNALTKIDADFNQFGDDIQNQLVQILAAILNNPGGSGGTVNVDLTEVLNVLKAMLDKLDSIDQNTAENKEISKKILEAIEKFGVSIADKLAVIIDGIGNDSTKLDKLMAFLAKMDENNKERVNKLLDAIAKLSVIGGSGGGDVNVTFDVDAIIDAINKAGGDMNAKMDEIIELLNKINNNVVSGNEQSKKLAEEIMETIKKLGFDVAGSLNVIIENMDGDSAKMEELLAFLKTMDANNAERNKAILEAIAKLGLDVAGSFTKLIDIGNKNNELQEETNNLIKELTTFIKNIQFSGGNGGTVVIDINAIVDAINTNGADIKQEIGDLKELIKTLNKNVVQGNEDNKKLLQDILAEIKKLGADVSVSLNTIIQQMNGDSAKMEELLAFLKTMDANNETRNKAILEAIAKLGVDVIEALNNLDVQVTVEGGGSGGPVDLSTVIDAINSVGGDINKTLGEIFDLLKTLNGNVVQGNIDNKQMAQLILNALANIENAVKANGDKLNLDEVMAILHDILDAIKNHEVTITVEGDGSCHCHCHQGDGDSDSDGDGDDTTHEGEQQDWNSVLGARASAMMWDDTTGVNKVKNNNDNSQGGVTVNGRYLKPGKYTGPAIGLGTGVYIVKDGKVFDLSGKEVNF